MKKTLLNLGLFWVLALLPCWSYAQVVFQNLTVQPVILCSGNPMTVTFQAALPGNSTGGQDLYLYGTIDSSATVSATSNVILWSGSTFNAGTDTFTGPPTVLSPSWAATWYMATPAFANFVTYTVISTVPAYANGTPVYITIGGDNAYTSGYTLPYSIQIPATVDCTKSDAINTGNGVFVNAGVTYTGASNPVTLQINNSCSSPTFTNTATMTFTKTPTSTFTNTFTPTISNTFTPTVTNTFTKTYTETFTNTFTPTITNTFTNTFTKTYTATFTNTATATFTATFTNTLMNTATFTNTFTKTYTSTFTNTPTATFTPTFTNTLMNTATFTNTFTKTYTSTYTNTTTSTFTPTFTNTFMNSPTFTNTFTVTPTNTVTNTPTASPTPTNTFTSTPTFTYTDTFVNSPTFTETFTNTPTLTYTNTFVNTPTFTNTFTNTPTFTDTNTFVNTPTFTNTFTATNTYTVTNTPTNTDTRTPTMTFTNTLVNTATATNTPTLTNTSTPTYTFTVTPTFTSFVGMGKKVSESEANAGDVLTYTIAVTVTGNGLTNSVITDVLPTNMTFQSFGSMPTGTSASSTNSNTQLQWILPSPLADGVYDLSYQLKVNTFAPANVALTNNAQLTYAGLLNPVKASVPVTVIGNFSVAVNIYNSAGEIVKTIPIQQFSTAINNIVLSTTNTITTLTGPGSTIEILFNGYVIGVWNGTNNSGQPVSNGSYRVQVDNIGSSGIVTSVSQNAIVSRNLSNVEVDIFNGAGEIVRKLYNVISNSTTSNMTNVILSSTAFKPDLSGPTSVTSGLTSQVQIFVQDTNAPVTLIWDGSNGSGGLVTPGEYQIEVHWTNGNGNTSDITRTVMVLPSTGVSGIAVARPNVLSPAKGLTTTFDATGVANASSLKVKIYTVAGELVQSFVSGNPTISWNASGLASGIYIANVEMDNASGGVVNNQRLKLLVLH